MLDTRFRSGRYGFDSVSLAMVLLAAVICGVPYLWIASLALVALAVARGFSRNIAARTREAFAFSGVMGRVGAWLGSAGRALARGFSGASARLRERRAYVVLRCPSCRAKLRLPRGRGKLAVTCPMCHCSFIHKT